MAMLSAIVEAGPRRMGALRPISDRLALGTLCIVTLGALFGLAASAQQNHEPRSEAAPPAATAPSPRRPYLQRLQVGSNRSWRALQAFSAIRQRRAACKV
jgi:hypothetical protein